MGDRAIVVFHTNSGEVSPGVYLHWDGYRTADFIRAAKDLLRDGDAGYSAARFCGYCHTQIEGRTGLGLLPAPDNLEPSTIDEYSHGDAGVFTVNVDTGAVMQHGGDKESFNIAPLAD